jgi:hypothetical protein
MRLICVVLVNFQKETFQTTICCFQYQILCFRFLEDDLEHIAVKLGNKCFEETHNVPQFPVKGIFWNQKTISISRSMDWV